MDPVTIALIASLGVGAFGNIWGAKQESDIQGTLLDLLQKYANLTPEQAAAAIQQFMQPMSQGLQNTILNKVQASMGERGLAGAPGLIAEATAQALSPYELEQQKLASQNYFNMLGLPMGITFPGSSQADLSGLAQMLFQQMGKEKKD
jgi:hypothetical protein